MIEGIDQLKTLKHISCECNCKFDGRKCNSGQWQNNDKCLCECKKRHVCEKDPATYNCENGKHSQIYLVSIIDDSTVICNEVRDANADAVADAESSNEANSSNKTHFNGNKATCKTQSFYLHFY